MNDIENPTPESVPQPTAPATEQVAEPVADPIAPMPSAQPQPQMVLTVPAPEAPRRRTWVPVVGGLVAGAVFGGAAGLGAGLLVAQNAGSSRAVAESVPHTITVNDTTSVNAVTAVAATAIDSVVTLAVTDEGVGSGTGSGVVLDDEGHIVTNAHVVTLGGATGDATVKVTTSAGRVHDAKIIGVDPLMDLAVIQVKGAPELVPISFADSSALNVGDVTIAIGAPLGYAGTVTSGIISALDRSIQVQSSEVPEEDAPPAGSDSPFGNFRFDLPGIPTPSQSRGFVQLPVIQTDTAINPGNSGGALLDANGRLIGINVAIASSGSSAGDVGVAFAIPSNVVHRIAAELIEHGAATHGLLGVTVVNVSQDPAQADAGIIGASVQTVVSGGAADDAGIRQGDIIVELDGVPIRSRNDLTAQVRTHGVGETVELVYVRDGSTRTAEVTLGDLDDFES